MIQKVCVIKTSLIDYPGEVAAAVFTPGCNLRCPYCHNPELVSGKPPENALPLKKLFTFLQNRRSVLGGVVVTGGEPLMHEDIPELIKKIRSMGYKIKIDTNGTFPDRLTGLDADFISMDIKTSPERYHLVGLKDPESVVRSARWLVQSGIPHEFRTTLAPGIVTEEDIPGMAEIVRDCTAYTLNRFRPKDTLDPEYENVSPYPEEVFQSFIERFASLGIFVRVREE